MGSEGPRLGRAAGWSLRTLPGIPSGHNSFQNNTRILVALFTLTLSVQWSFSEPPDPDDIPTLTAKGMCACMVVCFNVFSALMSDKD